MGDAADAEKEWYIGDEPAIELLEDELYQTSQRVQERALMVGLAWKLRLRKLPEGVWKTREGQTILIDEMSTGHLKNTVRMLQRANVDMGLPTCVDLIEELKNRLEWDDDQDAPREDT